jgi:hypothetical protein
MAKEKEEQAGPDFSFLREGLGPDPEAPKVVPKAEEPPKVEGEKPPVQEAKPAPKAAPVEEPKKAEAKPKQDPPKPVEAPAASSEEAKPKELTQAEKDQKYIHQLHMDRLEAERTIAVLTERLARIDEGLKKELSPEELAALKEEEKVARAAEKAAEKLLAERDAAGLAERARQLGTTPENLDSLRTWAVNHQTMQTAKNGDGSDAFPLMKDPEFKKFFEDAKTLEAVVNPQLDGRRKDKEVLADPATWRAAYYQAAYLHSRKALEKQDPPKPPSKEATQLAATVQPAPVTPAPAPKAAEGSGDPEFDAEWAAVQREAKSGLPT